jgi:peptidyl-prolyl cis-trans isomerase B (cyclophilin B)
MKKFSLAFALVLVVLTLSGCSQEPAAETLQSKKAGDYSYLSKAFGENSGGTNESATAPQASSGTQKKLSSQSAPQASSPTPQVAGDQTSADTSMQSKNTPAPTDTKPATDTPSAKQDTRQQDDDLKFIKKYDGAIIKTNKGDITVHFYNDDAPKTVNNFFKLAADDFYDGIRFHRVIKGFVIQAGDPNSKDDNWADDGQGGPGYTFDDEINSHKLVEGSVAMANSGPNTNGSQFFIVTATSTPLLDGKYTNFGEVTDGMNVVRNIETVATDKNDHPKENIEIKSIKFLEKK